MVMRVGGLASGMDIDELVKKLMQAERAPLNKLQQKKTTYEWQRDAYRGVNTKLKTFDTYLADNLVLKSMNSKTATSSNSSLVSATATGKASGTLTIEGVSQLATAARVTSSQVNATGSTKMSELATGTIKFNAVDASGAMPAKPTEIEISADMTVGDFVKKVNESNAGVSAVFENGRFSFTAKNTGKGNIEITGDNVSGMKLTGDGATKTEGTNAVFQVNGIATERSSNSFQINGYNVTLKDTFNSTATIANKYTAAQKEKDLAPINLTNKENALNDAIGKYYGAGAMDFPNYSSDHNVAYAAAFGSGILTLTQQEQYSKLSNTNWKSLTSEEFGVIKAANSKDPEAIKKAIDDDSNLTDEAKTKLKALSNGQLQTLADVSESDFKKFKEQANYEAFGGTKLKDLNDAAITKLQGLTITETTDIADIHAEIDSNTEFSDDLKATLKSLDKETLTSLKNMSTADLQGLATKATENEASNTLKQTYSELGDKAIAALSTSTVDPTAMTEEQKKAWGSLTSEQQTAWSNLSATQREGFQKLANQNIDRATFKTAEAEAKAAITRVENANSTYDTAKLDADRAGILNADGTLKQDVVDAAPKGQAVTMTSTTNVDDMMKTIKDFVNTYNGLIKDLKNQTGETKYRDYAPLTAEQKEEMSENEIKLWEEKAKSGLLRNDSLIRTGLADMRSLVYQSNPGLSDSKFNSLFSIGITTSKNYNEGGTLEIDETKLRKAIEEDPDAVEKLFKNSDGKKEDTVNGETVDSRGYLDKLRDSMKNFEISIEKKAGRSTMTDAQYSIGKSLMDTEKRISTWQDKLKNIEARYWKQFGAMESAINKANQQASMFMQG